MLSVWVHLSGLRRDLQSVNTGLCSTNNGYPFKSAAGKKAGLAALGAATKIFCYKILSTLRAPRERLHLVINRLCTENGINTKIMLD